MMPNLSEEQKIEKFRDILFSSEYVVFLGGAGVSTESGIPDFRSKNGLYHQKDKRYSKYRPEYLLSYDCLKHEPKIFFEYYRKNLDASDIKPNAAHLKLAEMENTGRLKGIVTQNIDGLHQKAGSINVQELAHIFHGQHIVIINKGKTKLEGKADVVFHESIGKILSLL